HTRSKRDWSSDVCSSDLVYQIYVNEIVFGSTNQKSCEEFSRMMMQKFEMTMMGELNYFLGFQVKQIKDVTFISQTKYTQELLKRSEERRVGKESRTRWTT